MDDAEIISLEVQVLIFLSDHKLIFADWLSIKSTCTYLYQIFSRKVVPQFLQSLRGEIRGRRMFVGITDRQSIVILAGDSLLDKLCGNNRLCCADVYEESVTENGSTILEIMDDKNLMKMRTTAENYLGRLAFDFCKVMFDGRVLKILYPDSVMTRHAHVTYNHLTCYKQLILMLSRSKSSNLADNIFKAHVSEFIARGFDVTIDI